MSINKKQGWCESVGALQDANMNSHMQALRNEEIDRDFLLMEFDVTAELIEKGYLHPDGSVKTLSNMYEQRNPKETMH